MAKRIITDEDIELYPLLTEQGLTVGDEYDFIEEDGDVGGSKPPDTKEKPDRP